jgi:hypothetical protein
MAYADHQSYSLLNLDTLSPARIRDLIYETAVTIELSKEAIADSMMLIDEVDRVLARR